MNKNFSHNTYIHLLIIAVLGFLIYSNTFHAHFELDDDVYIIQNSAIKDLSYFLEPSKVMGLTDIGINFRYAFFTRIAGYFTFALNYHFHGLDVTGYHVVNILIHIINALLVYFLIRLIFQTPFFSNAQPELTPFHAPGIFALFSALIFISHPVQTQAVTYITQRFASLATLFFVLSILAYVKSRLSGAPLKYGLYAVSLISAVTAMLVKEISFTLPVMIMLVEIFFFNGKYGKRALLLFPFALTMLVIPAALLTAQGSFSIEGIDKSMNTLASGPAVSRMDYLFTQFRVIVTYIRLLFLPVNQNLDYDYPVYRSFSAPPVFLSFLFLLFLFALGACLLYRSKKKEAEGGHYTGLISLGILWFFITLSVESSIIPIQDVIFEHRLYLPSVGFVMAVMAAVAMVVGKIGNRAASRVIIAVLVCAVCVLSAAAYARNGVWKTNVSLWEDIVEKSPSKARPHYNLGVAYTTQERTEEAVREFLAAIRVKPDYFEARFNLAKAYIRQGRIADAAREFHAAIQINPGHVEAHYNLGIVYSRQGDLANAIREYLMAITIDPGYFMAHNNLASIYLAQGRLEDAFREYERAIKIDPGHAAVHYNLGLAYAAGGRPAEAVREFESALRLKPDFVEAKKGLEDMKGMIK